MIDKLTSLSQMTTIVADTGDIDEIKLYKPYNATTNPSLILKVVQLSKYRHLINEAIVWSQKQTKEKHHQIDHASDKLIVNIGAEILKHIPGRVSTEIDARLSYSTNKSIKKAIKIIKLYEEIGIDKKFVLIKIASTWQGIKAAEYLEKQGIKCNLTLLFSFAQAKACADSGVFLISPFVGRILDWHQDKYKKKYTLAKDPGVISVIKIFNYYKKHNYKTLIMGASFRNINEILQLAGCDMLTISPNFLKELSQMQGKVERKLNYQYNNNIKTPPAKMEESDFFWNHSLDEMALIKLSEGIKNFADDQKKLEKIIFNLL